MHGIYAWSSLRSSADGILCSWAPTGSMNYWNCVSDFPSPWFMESDRRKHWNLLFVSWKHFNYVGCFQSFRVAESPPPHLFYRKRKCFASLREQFLSCRRVFSLVANKNDELWPVLSCRNAPIKSKLQHPPVNPERLTIFCARGWGTWREGLLGLGNLTFAWVGRGKLNRKYQVSNVFFFRARKSPTTRVWTG